MENSEASHLIVFNDTCGGKNQNINIACFWMYIVGNRNFRYKLVDHKFMISGHSYVPNDRDFSSIKENRKTQHVFVLFTVTKMFTSDLFSMDDVKSLIVHCKTNTNKEKVDWLGNHGYRCVQISPLKFSVSLQTSDILSFHLHDQKFCSKQNG